MGARVQDLFYCVSCEKKTTKTNKSYLVVELLSKNGKVQAKVWEDALSRAPFVADTVFYVEGKEDEYNGQKQLTVDSAQKSSDDPQAFLADVSQTPTLVFDIETVGFPFESLEEHSQQYLLERLERADTPEKQEQAKQKTGLYPLFGEVVAIGMLDTRGKGCVLLKYDHDVVMDDPMFTCEVFASEKELLTRFWAIVKKYERFVSFNGKNFDWPFLVFRSGVQRVPVSLPIKRFSNDDKNIDLMQEIPPCSNSYSLAEIAKAFGTFNPKAAGVSGGDVGELFAQNRQADVAQYVARDVKGTLELYEIWRQFLCGRVLV